jgi:hypothetical protein
MLTPAEELGLSGLGLAGRVRKAFYQVPEGELLDVIRRLQEEATRRHLLYARDGVLETIRILPCPITVLPDQLAYLHYVSQTILNALKRMPELYIQDFAVRDLLRLSPAEEAWLWECWGPSLSENNPVFGRLDAMIDFTSPMWKNSLHYVEPNLGGVGGLHLIPTCEQIVADVVAPVLRGYDDSLDLEIGPDVRELLIQDILDHLEAIGRPSRNVCFVEPKYAGTGPDEQEELARFYHDRYGLKIMHADPSELSLRGGEVFYGDDPVELAYRDYEVRDLLALERDGVDIAPMRTLFRQNRVVSSINAELDQKSCFEILSDPVFTRTYYSADERQVFRRHILWTRILSDRETRLPDGQSGNLLEYVRREHETLVLKPNRAYGGTGVQIGPALTAAEWEAAVERALADPDRWVVQQLAIIPVSEFPVVGPEGTLRLEPFYTVMGFTPCKYGLSVLARASQKQVVNVAQRGGMCAVMVGHGPHRLYGPGPHP